jgi:hypothetical protein
MHCAFPSPTKRTDNLLLLTRLNALLHLLSRLGAERSCERSVESVRGVSEKREEGFRGRTTEKKETEGKEEKERTSNTRTVLSQLNRNPLLNFLTENLPERSPCPLLEPRVELNQRPIKTKHDPLPFRPVLRVSTSLLHRRSDGAGGQSATTRTDDFGNASGGEAGGVGEEGGGEVEFGGEDGTDSSELGTKGASRADMTGEGKDDQRRKERGKRFLQKTKGGKGGEESSLAVSRP